MLPKISGSRAVLISATALVAGILFLSAGALPSAQAQPLAQATAQPTVQPTLPPTLPPNTPPAVSPVGGRTVTVSGSGSVEVTPDIAIIVVGVQTDAETASAALTQNNTQMQAVMSALTKANIAAKDIRTASVQLYPRYSSQPQTTNQATPTNQVVGYTAANTVEVTVRAIANVGTLLDQVVAAGGNQIQSIRFDVANQSQAMDQAREAAINDALHKAQQLASLTKTTLGPVVSINESSRVPVPFEAASLRAADSSVPISTGSQAIIVDLQVTWELQP